MNTYKITFSRENGTTGTDHFTAATEAQARRDFREVYRHGKGDIIDIELVSTDAPATKQQERDALEKIRKIVEQLGPDSYVGTAFQGCFEIAAENIENDFACSMADKVHRAEADVVRLREANTLAATRVNKLENIQTIAPTRPAADSATPSTWSASTSSDTWTKARRTSRSISSRARRLWPRSRAKTLA